MQVVPKRTESRGLLPQRHFCLRGRTVLAPEGTSSRSTPLMGFIRGSLPPIQPRSVHSRLTEVNLRRGDANSTLVPSLPFLPTPTVYSATRPAGLLHPATGLGVRPVLGACRSTLPPLGRSTLRSFHPLVSLTASPGSPLSPRLVPSRCCSVVDTSAAAIAILRVFLQRGSSVQHASVATLMRSMLPWASGL